MSHFIYLFDYSTINMERKGNVGGLSAVLTPEDNILSSEIGSEKNCEIATDMANDFFKKYPNVNVICMYFYAIDDELYTTMNSCKTEVEYSYQDIKKKADMSKANDYSYALVGKLEDLDDFELQKIKTLGKISFSKQENKNIFVEYSTFECKEKDKIDELEVFKNVVQRKYFNKEPEDSKELKPKKCDCLIGAVKWLCCCGIFKSCCKKNGKKQSKSYGQTELQEQQSLLPKNVSQ